MRNFSDSWALRTLPWCLMTALTAGSLGVHAQVTAPVAKSSAVMATGLTLKDLVRQVREANKDIRSKRAEKEIAQTGIDRASAAFQPVATLSATNGVNRQPNTYEEKLVRSNQALYLRDGQDYSAGVSQLLPTGAKLEAKTTLSRFITNINQLDGRPEGAKDNRTFMGLTLTQPLAKDGGFTVTNARTDVAELDVAVAQHTQFETESSVVAEASLAYYELVLAQHRVAAANEKIRTSQRLLTEARSLNRQGRLAEADVWEIENALSRFRAGLSEAVQGERERLNRLNTLVMAATGTGLPTWRASDALPAVVKPSSSAAAEASVRLALDSRHDFLMQKKLLEREGVQLVYAQNQALPRIDLIASYGRNGLAYSAQTAFSADTMRNYPTWSMGLQMQIPLGENRQGRADVASASLRRENALLAIKALEVQIANDIDTSLNMLASASERWEFWQDVARREQQQLDVEYKRFAAGRSEMREIMMREEKTVNSRLMVIEQQVAFAKAQIILESAQGVLLERWPS
ncbi:TolC family protein [Limnohabitans sp. TS-CS-82]|uniref:TolC family protein n=1 Tax=Limnohabitans sp. TS-CS-82 TaxID=2094193 RepID=UPI0013752DF2|nr:TolC family protein [Limnohabitans sp. TS-CS-82]